MRVSIIQTYNPIFTSIKRSGQKPIIPINKPDTFERKEFDCNNEINDCYFKLQKSLKPVTPSDVCSMVNQVHQKTGVASEDIYKTMGILSQYSSYKSLQFIENSLSSRGISLIMNVPAKFLDNNIPLTNVMSYIASKNFPLKISDDALIIDSTLLKTFKNMDLNSKKLFYQYVKDYNLRLLYFENFENGYNFLNQEKSFEDYTIDVLQKATKFQKKNGKNLDYNVRYVLNGDNYKAMKSFSGIGYIDVIKQEDTLSTPESIADNLNPIMPDLEEFKSVIHLISKRNVGIEKDLIKFLNKTLTVVSPRQYAKYLQDIHKQLLQYLKEHDRTMDDVYFVIPSMNKSFIPANYVYMKVNNIENPKYVFMTGNYDLKTEHVEKLPDNSVAVVIDDCILSGLSMKDEIFPYTELSDTLQKDKKIIFGPIICLNLGKNMIENIAKSKNRDDKVICGKFLPDLKMKSKNLTLVQGINTNANITTSVIFPYMGPDFNCDELVPLYEKFLFNKRAQKVCIGDINEFTLG